MIILLFLTIAFLLLFGNIALWFTGKKHIVLAFDVVLLAALAFFAYSIYSNGISASYFGMVSVNSFSAFFALVFTLGMLLISVLAYEYSASYADFAVLSGFALAGMYSVAFAYSLIMILLGLELASIPSLFIILLSKKNSIEAATKYLIMSALAVATLAFAIVLAYGAANSLALSAISKVGYAIAALAFFVVSLGFESAQFPFSVLLPDVYQGSSAYATAMLGGVNEKLGFAALIQVLVLLLVGLGSTFVIAAALSVLTMFYGNIVALAQTNLKRLFAYSSISQAGYIMIGIATATKAGIAASLVQIFAHMFLFIGVLAIVAWLEKRNRNNVDDLIGLSSENKIAAFGLTLFMLSLIGLPLTVGFIGKFLLFLSATVSGMVWLAILGIINSVISIFYYAKPITAIFTNKYEARKIGMDRYTVFVVAVCIAIVLIFGIYPGPLISFATSAASFVLR
ncbi:MAG: NADH-quinone oxidoreductase subunit N [Candidatus Micrarchaeaceae archaeon]